jgi:transcriptional regulator with XRE-family HTH domain
MNAPTLETLGRKLQERRAGRGIREVAGEIGVSAATLSRVERGYLPDLETFTRICRWLQVDPGEVLRLKRRSGGSTPAAAVHFKKDHAVTPRTAQALAELILAAQRALLAAEQTGT